MLVVKIDALYPQPFEARLAGLDHVFGPSVRARPAVGLAHVAELGRQHGLVASVGDRTADEFLVAAIAIGI